MARFTPRQIITTISVFYLLLLTILAGYALHRNNTLSLPIPNVQAALTLALPPLAGIVLETLISFQSSLALKTNLLPNNTTSKNLPYTKTFQTLTALFLIYETVLATLSGTHIAPIGGLWCPLHDRWQSLYKNKDGRHIRAIQDALECCGFASMKDMAWPFPGQGRNGGGGAEMCSVRFEERTRACLEPWRNEERKVAVMLLIVPVGVFLWKLALFLAAASESSWLPSGIRLPSESSRGSNLPRPAIMYRDIEQQGDDDSLREEVSRLNKDSTLATHVENGRRGPRVVASPLIQEQENGWRSD